MIRFLLSIVFSGQARQAKVEGWDSPSVCSWWA
jgi:hypothetical protein